MTDAAVQRWAAFTDTPGGGNPAGLVLGADELDDDEMQRIAGQVGYAETAFVTGEGRERGIRFFSPIAEVPFCGHATVAAAVALAADLGDGVFTFHSSVGPIDITTRSAAGRRTASFTSVDPWVRELPGPTLDALLALIGVDADALDPRHPPRLAFAGNPHPLIVLREAGAFDDFSFDAARARQLMDAEGWPATVIVLHDLGRGRWESRNIFPVGTLSEDPATGAGAAATGGYLRAMGAVRPPARIEIEQGRHVGRPGLLVVDIPPTGGVTVTGSAVPIH